MHTPQLEHYLSTPWRASADRSGAGDGANIDQEEKWARGSEGQSMRQCHALKSLVGLKLLGSVSILIAKFLLV